ncbi:MAG TPA: hypothetical protein VM166_08580 [Gemmatimonadaceae bacterium]|nr:hypothetical protein [Gemmatimonadaceae bacterium]
MALALDVETKWLDNVLTHYKVPGASQDRQGVARRLSGEAVSILHLAINLLRELGVPISRGIDLATKLVNGQGNFVSPGKISVSFDFLDAEALLHSRLAAAVEVAPVPRRGRPAQSKTGRLE